MSTVFRARDRLTDRIVALKRMTRSVDRAAIAAEFRTLATLRHPNIISVFDYGFSALGEPFLTMELVERPRSLLEASHDRSPREQTELLAQLLRALSYLHRRGVIHRDLKPSNVLVDDHVRVLDFGISVRRGEAANVAGTLSHIAPELLRGEAPTESADLYAVGVMAYEMFVGRHPFHGFDLAALRASVLTRPPDLEPLAATPALRAFVGRMLAKDPAGRPASADDALGALTEATGIAVSRQTRATRESFLQAADFVDRRVERQSLADAVTGLLNGAGSTWLIAGESGIGKSRLLDEIRTLALVSGARVVQGQADRELGAAYQLWQEPLRTLVLAAPLDDAEAATLSALLPDIDELLERPIPRPPASAPPAPGELFAAVCAVFERQRDPVVVILEDVHWAGEGLDWLRALTLRLPGLPVMLLASFRNEEHPGLALTIPAARLLRLSPLVRDDIAMLARSMLGAAGAPAPVVEFLDRHTDGNVFFVVEAVRALADGAGSLEQVGAAPLPERLVAQGIDAVVGHRLAKLPDRLVAVFEWSAVLGRLLDLDALGDVFEAALVAEALEFGSEITILDKFREHMLEALGDERRRALHGEVAAALERVHGGSKRQAAALAHHYREAGSVAKERHFAELAGQAALEQGAYADATRHLERALALDGGPEAELGLLLSYGAVLGATRSWSAPEYERTYDRVVELARLLGKQEELLPAMHGSALAAGFRGDLARGRTLTLRFAELAEDVGDTIGRVQAALLLANLAKWLGRHDEAEVHHQRVIDLYEDRQLPVHMSRYGWHPRVVTAVTHAASACIVGRPERAVRLMDDALALARASEHPFTLAIALQIGAWVHHLRREVDDTLRFARALDGVAREYGFPTFSLLADMFAGWARVHGGDVEGGLAQLRAAFATQQRLGGITISFYAAILADAWLVADRVAEARELLCAILDDAGVQGRAYHPELYRLLAEVRRREQDLERAEAALQHARGLAERQGAGLFEARALVGLLRLRGARPGELERLTALRSSWPDIPDARAVDALVETLPMN